jgi:hypothetical protein
MPANVKKDTPAMEQPSATILTSVHLLSTIRVLNTQPVPIQSVLSPANVKKVLSVMALNA